MLTLPGSVLAQALAHLDALPEGRRMVRAMRALRSEIETDLARIDAVKEAKTE